MLVAILYCFAGNTTIFAATEDQQAAKTEVEAALQLTPNLENGKKVYKLCVLCHRREGWGSTNGTYPQIAGQLPSVVIKQLADIRAGNRDNPNMIPFTSPKRLGGVQEIADVSAYISNLLMNPKNGLGSGNDLAHGEQLYKENCTKCHGANGEGNPEDHVPLIQGQHYMYLKRQFDWILSGKRRNADPQMAKQIEGFNIRDVSAVLDYVSRLRPPEEKLAEPGWRNPDFSKSSR